MQQFPSPGTYLRRFAGDTLIVTLQVPGDVPGRAFVRTNLGHAAEGRRERLAAAAEHRAPLAVDWHDIPMVPQGQGLYSATLSLPDVGLFRAKTLFLPTPATSATSATPATPAEPVWPVGDDLHIKVAPASSRSRNSIYTAFTRCFTEAGPSGGSRAEHGPSNGLNGGSGAEPGSPNGPNRGSGAEPPAFVGTFRSLIRRLDTILGDMGFGILQLLPIHPAPTTYARMGEYGSPFAGLDFLAVDPAYAEFDPAVPPIGQFRELVDAVHARGARLFLDLPANHTGWASTLLAHHPEWFRRDPDGRFHSPGAWGVVWEDLVELDYSRPGLREFMASVFEYWCEEGVDGFRCDAGYMIPQDVWSYIVDRVRSRFPETVFLLEGLGGKISVTRALLDTAGLDCAYSEIFQTEDRSAFERYLPDAQRLSDEAGPLVHFAETHDNLRLAARSPAYSRMRVALAALLSPEGAFGITCGVEWFATERIDVHSLSDLRWGAAENQVADIGRLNALVASHPAFGPGSTLHMVQTADGNSLAVLRCPVEGGQVEGHTWPDLLILANLDPASPQPVNWPASAFDCAAPIDLLSGATVHPLPHQGGLSRLLLEPGQVLCLSNSSSVQPEIAPSLEREALAEALHDEAFPLHTTELRFPTDCHRIVPVPPHHRLLLRSAVPLRALLPGQPCAESVLLEDGTYALLQAPLSAPSGCSAVPAPSGTIPLRLLPGRSLDAQAPSRAPSPRGSTIPLLPLPATSLDARALPRATTPEQVCLLTNGRGAMSHVRVAWPLVASRYDALLAANPDPAVPCDRWILFSRCRLWARHLGYSQALDASALDSFETDGSTGRWRFRLHLGSATPQFLTLSLFLVPGENRVTLTFSLSEGSVSLILRPDLESRSFHELTKAYAGAEAAWPAACTSSPRGVSFHPDGRPGLDLEASNGDFVPESEWSYCVSLPHDAQRGQDASTDLFSPGFFRIPLEAGKEATLTASATCNSATLQPSLSSYIVARDDVSTVIAGYPWFLDWGRDTFIVLRGMIAAGLKKESLDIVRAFARFEKNGTLPNMIRGNDDSNRDTSDAPLWFSVAVQDLCVRYGRSRILSLDCGGRTLLDVLVAIASGYRRGTPNGIAMDPATALVYSPPHFTWMDTNFPAGTPRAGYPVEIQALWIRSLRFLARVQPHADWATLADRATASVRSLFWLPAQSFFADCLAAAHPCADSPLRPNQLFLFTLGVLDPALPEDRARMASTLRACARLLIPGAIRTLDDAPVATPLPVVRDGVLLNDPLHPYWGAYAGDEDTRRKPAYHNGTAWTWLFPSYVEALLRVYGDAALPTARALLASVAPLLQSGAIGHLPEILDGDAPHAPRGCDAQAWGDSELLRVSLLAGFSLSPAPNP